jgi:glycerol-3-phosphate dehydrogenase (NAD(P)+)
LALILARNGFLVKLWCFDPQQAQAMQQARCNMDYLPAHPFPENLQVTHSLTHALAKAKDILIVVPSQGFRDLISAIKPHLKPSMRIVWGTKGLDASSHQLLHEVVKEILGKLCPIAILSGPSFAGRSLKGCPPRLWQQVIMRVGRMIYKPILLMIFFEFIPVRILSECNWAVL